MRYGEILLLLVNLLTFLVLALPRLRAVQGARAAALLTLPIAGIQALVEGVRWQMIPAYTVSAAFFLVWLLDARKPIGQTPALSRLLRPFCRSSPSRSRPGLTPLAP